MESVNVFHTPPLSAGAGSSSVPLLAFEPRLASIAVSRSLRSVDADRWTVGLVAVVLAGAFLRFYRLGEESLWLDEVYSVLDVTTRTTRELVFMPFIKLHLPLYYLILDGWVELFGLSEGAIRTPSALFGIAAIVAIYLVGTRLYDRQVGFLSALLLAFSEHQVHYSQEARMYSLLVLLTTLSFYWLIRVASEGSRRDLAGYLVTTILLTYTHPFSLFILLTQNLYVLTAPVLGRDTSLTIPLRRWIETQLVVGVAVASWVVYTVYDVLENEGSPSWISEPTLGGLVQLPFRYFGWRSTPEPVFVSEDLLWAIRLVVMALVVGCVLVGLANRPIVRSTLTDYAPTLGERREGESHHRTYLLALWATVPILVPAALSFLLDPMLSVRYTIPASVGLFVLAANGVRNLSYAHLNVVVAVALLGTLVFPLAGYYAVENRPQWEEATDYVAENADSDDLVLVHHSPLAYIPFDYYFDRDDVVTDIVANRAGNERLADGAADQGTLWIVFMPSDGDHILEIVEETHHQAENQSFHDVEVYRYEPGEETADAVSAPGPEATAPLWQGDTMGGVPAPGPPET